MSIQPADVSRFLDASGWSQARLAWELGVNQPRISRFIAGPKRPKADLQRALNTFFAEAALRGARRRAPRKRHRARIWTRDPAGMTRQA